MMPVMTDTTTWTDELTVDDLVIITHIQQPDKIAKVVKVTKQFFEAQITSNKHNSPVRFNKRTLRRTGETDAWMYTTVSEATPERVINIRRRNMAARLKRVRQDEWEGLTLEDMHKIYRMLYP